jgi:hypothetical protein
MKYWEIIADNLSKAGWSSGCVSAIDSNGRTIWIADAHRDDGKRFVVHAGWDHTGATDVLRVPESCPVVPRVCDALAQACISSFRRIPSRQTYPGPDTC